MTHFTVSVRERGEKGGEREELSWNFCFRNWLLTVNRLMVRRVTKREEAGKEFTSTPHRHRTEVGGAEVSSAGPREKFMF